MKRWFSAVGLAIPLVLSACASSTDKPGDGNGGDGPPADLDVIASTPARGTIAGVSWTLGTRFMDIDGGSLFIDLLQDAVPDCTKDETNGSFPFAIFFTPPAAGRYPLGEDKSQFVTFVDKPSDNLIVSQGVIQIDSITQTTVTGGLHVFDPGFGEINGRFDGPLCFDNTGTP